jgi:hypothetical protein
VNPNAEEKNIAKQEVISAKSNPQKLQNLYQQNRSKEGNRDTLFQGRIGISSEEQRNHLTDQTTEIEKGDDILRESQRIAGTAKSAALSTMENLSMQETKIHGIDDRFNTLDIHTAKVDDILGDMVSCQKCRTNHNVIKKLCISIFYKYIFVGIGFPQYNFDLIVSFMIFTI